MRILVVLVSVCLFFSAGCSGSDSNQKQPTPGEQSIFVQSHVGTTVSLADGARFILPADALPEDATITFGGVSRDDPLVKPFELGQPVGNLYALDLQGLTLNKPAFLEFPVDESLIPAGRTPEELFVMYQEEGWGHWEYAGGTYDQSRKVIVLETVHATLFNPTTWNLDAMRAAINKGMHLDAKSLLEAVLVITTTCQQNLGDYWVATEDAGIGSLQGCLLDDAPGSLQVKVLNPTAFAIKVNSTPQRANYPRSAILGPAEDVSFTIQPSQLPVTVQAAIDAETLAFMVAEALLAILPSPASVAADALWCYAQRTHNIPYVRRAAEALLSGDTDSFAHEVESMLQDTETTEAWLATVRDDCSFNQAILKHIKSPALSQIATTIRAGLLSTADLLLALSNGTADSKVTFTDEPPERAPSGGARAFDPTLDTDKDSVLDGVDGCQLLPETFNAYQDDDGCPDDLPEVPTATGPAPSGNSGPVPTGGSAPQPTGGSGPDQPSGASGSGPPTIVVPGTPAASAEVWTDRTSYIGGAQGQICFSISQPGRVLISYTSAQGDYGVFWDEDEAAGSRCEPATFTPPYGNEVLRIELFSGGNLVASGQTSYQILEPAIPEPQYSLTLTLDNDEYAPGDSIGYCYHLSPENVPYGTRLFLNGVLVYQSEDNGINGGDCLQYVLPFSEVYLVPSALTMEAYIGGARVAAATAYFAVVDGGPLGQPPAAPSNLQMLTGNLAEICYPVEQYNVWLAWYDNSDNETHFEIWDGTTTLVSGANTDEHCTYAGTGTFVCFGVRAVNAFGVSPWSNQACATIETNSPGGGGGGGGPQLLGGMNNLDGYCQATYGLSAQLSGSDWICGPTQGNVGAFYPLDMDAACVWHYGAGAYAQQTDPNNPFSWNCYR